MNKVLFSRKASNLQELKSDTSTERSKSPFIIEKIIELSSPQFQQFSENLVDDFTFIAENTDLMYVDTDGIWHCILVNEQGCKKGILVESEGYGYARYAAYHEEYPLLKRL